MEPLQYWPTGTNIADLATKDKARVEDILQDSAWQRGPEAIRFSRDSWPKREAKKACPPPSEFRIACVTIKEHTPSLSKVKEVLDRVNKLEIARNSIARFIRASSTGDRGDVKLPVTTEYLDLADTLIQLLFVEETTRATKSTLQHLMGSTMIGEKPTLNYAELQSILSRAADVINDRPIGVRNLTEENIVPLTPNQLIQGRTTTARKEASPEEVESFTQVSKYQEELLSVWWRMWAHQVFPSLLPFSKYKDAKRNDNLKPGDICLLKYDSKVRARYKLCRVSEVFPHDDDIVRTVKVKFRPNQKNENPLPYIPKKLVELEVAVQRLVLIQAVEDLEDAKDNTGGGDACEGRTKSHLGAEINSDRSVHQGRRGPSHPLAAPQVVPGLVGPGTTENSSGSRGPHYMGLRVPCFGTNGNPLSVGHRVPCFGINDNTLAMNKQVPSLGKDYAEDLNRHENRHENPGNHYTLDGKDQACMKTVHKK